MKVVKYIFIALFSLIFSACNSNETPENVAEKFAKAYVQLDYTTLKKYSTPESLSIVDIYHGYRDATPDESDVYKKIYENAKIEINKSIISEDGKTALVVLKIIGDESASIDFDLNLINEDGSWKVVFPYNG